MEADHLLWLAVLSPNDECVKDYESRVRQNQCTVEYAWACTWGSVMDEWIRAWDRKAHERETMPSGRGAGCAFPMAMSEALNDIWIESRGMHLCTRACTRAARTRTRPRSHTSCVFARRHGVIQGFHAKRRLLLARIRRRR
jgi:hypothetical protein